MKSEIAFFKDKRWRDFVQFCQLIRFLGFTDDEIIAEVRKIMAAINTEPSPSDVSVTPDVLIDIKTGRSIEKETCSWIQEDDPDICYWKTGCGNSFYFTEGAPTDNRMKYCCYCGRLLKQEE